MGWHMNIDVYVGTLKEIFLTHLETLKDFYFSVSNPLFWIFFVICFLILSRFCGARKSFSFCTIVAIILLAYSKLEGIAAHRLGVSDPFLIRGLVLFIIAVIFIYYFFIKDI